MRRAASLFLLLTALPAAAQYLALGTISGTVTYGSEKNFEGWVTYIDLRSGRVTPVVTGKSPSCPDPNQVLLIGTDEFARTHGTFVAITANTGPYTTGCGTPVGLIRSDGVTVTRQEDCGLELYFTSAANAAITDGTLPPLDTIRWAVSGSTSTDNDCLPLPLLGSHIPQPKGGLLVRHGHVSGCVAPKSRSVAPRSAAGIDVTGTILILVAIAGSEDASGLTLPDLSSLLIGLGAYEAVNFDGGGSTAFIWNPFPVADSPTLINMMTHAHFPDGVPNANGLAFTVAKRDPSESIIHYCANGSTCRPVYASLGFTVNPQTKK